MATRVKTRPKSKQCNGCGRTLPLEEFGRHAGHGTDNRESQCKACMRVAERRKREAKRPVDYPHPLLYRELQPEQKKMVERTPDGFKLFFEKYSGLKLMAHEYQWAKVAIENDLLLLNVPPGHGKTTCMAQWFVIWDLARDRNSQVIVVSKTNDGAKKTAYKIAYELEFNRQLNQDFGRFRPRDGNAKWSTGEGALLIDGKDLSEGSGDVSVQIRGMQQQILGMRATLIIADDVSDRAIARSEQGRKDQLEWFLGDVMTRLQPDGKAVCIGQRVHSEDLYGQLSNHQDDDQEQVWNQIKTPAIIDKETKQVLWPEWWTWERLQKVRGRLGPALFETMYQQNPEAAGAFIKKEWITDCLDRNRIIGQGARAEGEAAYLPITRVLSIDPSPTRMCGMVVVDTLYLPGQTQFVATVVDVRQLGPNVTPRQMFEEIEQLLLEHSPTICIVEENSVKGWLRESPEWNMLVPMFRKVIMHNTGRNKQDPLYGVWSLGADFEAGRIRLPYGDEDSRRASELLISEALAYDNGRTDDVLMALWFIKPNFKQLIPLEHIATRFNRGLNGGGTWRGWVKSGA